LNMKALIGANIESPDSTGAGFAWFQGSDSILLTASSYVFSFYQFSSPEDSGTWCNSDDPTFFSSYTQTSLALNPADNPDTFQTDVFLVFNNLNSMIHVYRFMNDFSYAYAPVGVQATVVATGVKEGKLYSSFVPITIGMNQVINFTLSQTTTSEFKVHLNSLN